MHIERTISELEFAVSEIGAEECLVFGLASDRLVDGDFQVIEVVRDEVGQVGIVGMISALLNRIEIWGVCR